MDGFSRCLRAAFCLGRNHFDKVLPRGGERDPACRSRAKYDGESPGHLEGYDRASDPARNGNIPPGNSRVLHCGKRFRHGDVRPRRENAVHARNPEHSVWDFIPGCLGDGGDYGFKGEPGKKAARFRLYARQFRADSLLGPLGRDGFRGNPREAGNLPGGPFGKRCWREGAQKIQVGKLRRFPAKNAPGFFERGEPGRRRGV